MTNRSKTSLSRRHFFRIFGCAVGGTVSYFGSPSLFREAILDESNGEGFSLVSTAHAQSLQDAYSQASLVLAQQWAETFYRNVNALPMFNFNNYESFYSGPSYSGLLPRLISARSSVPQLQQFTEPQLWDYIGRRYVYGMAPVIGIGGFRFIPVSVWGARNFDGSTSIAKIQTTVPALSTAQPFIRNKQGLESAERKTGPLESEQRAAMRMPKGLLPSKEDRLPGTGYRTEQGYVSISDEELSAGSYRGKVVKITDREDGDDEYLLV